MRMIGKMTTAAAALAFAVAVAACGQNTSSSQYAGTYKTKDTAGGDFEITLAADGKASGTRGAEALTGTWKEDGGAAVIKWDSGWTTKIAKEGDAYKKTGYEKDASAAPSSTSDAVKVK
jgi:hypothetical protein